MIYLFKNPPCHGGWLSGGEDADGPDVEGGRPELAAQEEPAPVDVCAHLNGSNNMYNGFSKV